ncbi:hypothetical protein H0H93_006927 [Arthromyces matolae]|nr:hypothetical protein H0H93_006927 [Arthromyces matolae]
MSTDSLLVPLSRLDHGYLELLSVVSGYVVRSVDVSALQAAAIRVVDKWRLLAGRVVWSKKHSAWCVLVPLKGDVSSRLKFTVTRLTTRLDSSFVVNDSLSAQVLPRPPIKYFTHPSVPNAISSRSSSKSPIISIHVTQFSNCACIGINFPHGVLDAFGLGQFISALDHELHARPWEAPSLPEPGNNILQEALDELEALPSLYDDIHLESTTYAGLRRELAKFSLINGLAVQRSVLSENFWGQVEDKTVYLNGKTLGKLLREVKDEVKRIDSELRVSTSNILVAWLLKAMYSEEVSDTKPVSLSSAVSLRHTLEKKYPAMKDYSHNAIMFCSSPSLTKQQLAEKSVAELAIFNHQALQPSADEAWIQAYNRYLQRGLKGPMSFGRGLGRNDDPWMFTNQTIGRIDQIDFGSKMHAMFGFLTPLEPNHVISLNKFRDGYMIQGNARRSRWMSVIEAVEKLQPATLRAHL